MKYLETILSTAQNMMTFNPSVKVAEFFSSKKSKMTGHLTLVATVDGKVVYNYSTPNVIVDSASKIIASLLKGDSSSGISKLKFGTGDASWDKQNPPAPKSSTETLVNEVVEQSISKAYYVNPSTGAESADPTNVVDFVTVLPENTPAQTVALVEMGLSTEDDTLLNYRTFPVINKTPGMLITVIFRITT